MATTLAATMYPIHQAPIQRGSLGVSTISSAEEIGDNIHDCCMYTNQDLLEIPPSRPLVKSEIMLPLLSTKPQIQDKHAAREEGTPAPDNYSKSLTYERELDSSDLQPKTLFSSPTLNNSLYSMSHYNKQYRRSCQSDKGSWKASCVCFDVFLDNPGCSGDPLSCYAPCASRALCQCALCERR